MTPRESALLLAGQHVTDVPPGVLSGTRTGAFAGAPPQRGRHPLVVLSPGFSLPRSSLTSLAEDLASRGYVVAAIDHTYESFGRRSLTATPRPASRARRRHPSWRGRWSGGGSPTCPSSSTGCSARGPGRGWSTRRASAWRGTPSAATARPRPWRPRSSASAPASTWARTINTPIARDLVVSVPADGNRADAHPGLHRRPLLEGRCRT